MVNEHLASMIYEEYKSKNDDMMILAIVNSVKYHEQFKTIADSGDDDNSLFNFVSKEYLKEIKGHLCKYYCENKDSLEIAKKYADKQQDYFDFIGAFCTILSSTVIGEDICQNEEASYLFAIYYFVKLIHGGIVEYCGCM